VASLSVILQNPASVMYATEYFSEFRIVGQVARSSGNVRQPNQVVDDHIARHQVERRPGAGEEWTATTQHDGAQVESILIDETSFGQTLRQDWSANVNLASLFDFQPA